MKEIDPSVEFKYNRAYIGLARNGLATNFVMIRPRKKHVIIEVKLPRSEEISALIENAGIDSLTYSNRWGRYRMSISAKDVEEQTELLLDLIKRSYDTYYS